MFTQFIAQCREYQFYSIDFVNYFNSNLLKWKFLLNMINSFYIIYIWASLMAHMIKICLQFRRPRFDPWVRMIHWRKEWLPAPVFLPRELHGQKSLESSGPWCYRIIHNWVTHTPTHTHPHTSFLKLFPSLTCCSWWPHSLEPIQRYV